MCWICILWLVKGEKGFFASASFGAVLATVNILDWKLEGVKRSFQSDVYSSRLPRSSEHRLFETSQAACFTKHLFPSMLETGLKAQRGGVEAQSCCFRRSSWWTRFSPSPKNSVFCCWKVTSSVTVTIPSTGFLLLWKVCSVLVFEKIQGGPFTSQVSATGEAVKHRSGECFTWKFFSDMFLFVFQYNSWITCKGYHCGRGF